MAYEFEGKTYDNLNQVADAVATLWITADGKNDAQAISELFDVFDDDEIATEAAWFLAPDSVDKAMVTAAVGRLRRQYAGSATPDPELNTEKLTTLANRIVSVINDTSYDGVEIVMALADVLGKQIGEAPAEVRSKVFEIAMNTLMEAKEESRAAYPEGRGEVL